VKPPPVNVSGLTRASGRDVLAQVPGTRRETLECELQDQLAKLNEQARIFIPLIALLLIASIPVWSKPAKLLLLLLSPFVLLPLAFCIAHLLLAWRRIAKARGRIHEWDMLNGREEES